MEYAAPSRQSKKKKRRRTGEICSVGTGKIFPPSLSVALSRGRARAAANATREGFVGEFSSTSAETNVPNWIRSSASLEMRFRVARYSKLAGARILATVSLVLRATSFLALDDDDVPSVRLFRPRCIPLEGYVSVYFEP